MSRSSGYDRGLNRQPGALILLVILVTRHWDESAHLGTKPLHKSALGSGSFNYCEARVLCSCVDESVSILMVW